MKKCVIFGCGNFGTESYLKLKKLYEIIAWSDNNFLLWGKEKEGIRIIAPFEILSFINDDDVDVVVSINSYEKVCIQLLSMGIKQIFVWRNNFLYRWKQGEVLCQITDIAYPCENEIENKIKKGHILFVQETACIRTHKIAKALRDYGFDVSLAYLKMPPNEHANPEYKGIYTNIYPIYSIQQLINFVNQSDFDLIHSSNTPDVLTMILNQSNKPIVHDCHDLSSAYTSMSPEKMFIEFAANRNSHGVIYPTEGLKKEALKKFHIPDYQTFVLENLISEELKSEKKLEKLSKIDQKLHCVYEGGVVPNDKESHRYFECIWTKLAKSGAHVHFYTNCNLEYCRYLDSLHERIHFEGNYSSKQLAVEMTKYDIGLCVFNTTFKYKQYLELASPNKIQEYLNAGIPVAVGNITSQKKFVEENRVGKELDLTRDIYHQLQEIASIQIKDNFLHEKGYTLESKIPKLIEFYNKCSKGGVII